MMPPLQVLSAPLQLAIAARVVSDLTYGLAQLHLAKDRPRKSLQLIEQWFSREKNRAVSHLR